MTRPGGTEVVLLFSDIESSTQLWEQFPNDMKAGLARHDEIVRSSIESDGGSVVKTTGDGVMATFGSPLKGLEAGVMIQQSLTAEDWGPLGEIKVRIALHVGEPQRRGDDYFGPVVNRTARLMAAGHGGQTLLSAAMADRVEPDIPEGTSLRDLGRHRLKDLSEPENVFEIQLPNQGVFPPLTSLDLTPNNLPTLTSSFLGRDDEQREIRQLIEKGDSRLLTLVGTGGTGKTRLGLQAAADQIDRFSDGVFFVDLSTEVDADESFANVARILGIDSAADESALEALLRGLTDRSTLLVLDNLEQIDAIGVGVNQLLHGCPGVAVLATSREPLRVSGEQLYPIEPLSVPQITTKPATSDDVRGSEAGLLFEERAQQTSPNFTVEDSNAPSVAAILVQLDGLPLGVELAATRLRMFTVQELEQRLAKKLDVLKSGAHDVPERQRTLRDTIEWSYELLKPNEQQLIELLSIFASASYDDLESIADRILLEGDVLDDLDSLVDKSLVRKTATAAGQSRFGLLETIRSFARENSQGHPVEYETTKTAHAVHFADLAVDLLTEFKGPEREWAKARLTSELENFQISWTFWRQQTNIDRLHQLFDPMWILYDAEGWYQGAVTLAEDLLDVLDDEPDSSEKTSEQIALRTSLARARMLIKGYTEEAEKAFLEALAQAEASGATPQRFPVLRSLASLYTQRRETEKALEIGEQLLAIAAKEADPALAVDANLVYGVNRAITQDLDDGMSYVDKAVAAFDPSEMHGERFRLGPHSGVISLTTSAFLLTWQGYADQARARAGQALVDADELGHSYSKAYALFHVAFFNLIYRDIEAVAEYADQLLALANQYDFQIWRALAIVLRGVVEAFTVDPVDGARNVEKGIELYQRLPTPPVFWAILLSVRAPVAAMAGDIERGLDLINQAIELEPDPTSAMAAEFFMTRGDLLLMQQRDREAAEAFVESLQNAKQHGSKFGELRALTRLARDGDENYRARLQEVYDWFTEGFDVADLIEAQEVLSS